MKTCPECGKEYAGGREEKVYCSEVCRKKAEQRRYQQNRKQRQPQKQPITVVCLNCGEQFVSAAKGRKAEFCSTYCKEAHRREIKKQQPTGRYCLTCGNELSSRSKEYCFDCINNPEVYTGKIEARPCVVCGNVFRPKIDSSVCCSSLCASKYGAILNAAGGDTSTIKTCVVCGIEFHPLATHKNQKTCGSDKCQQRLDIMHKTVTGKRKDIHGRRKAVIRGAEAEKIDVLFVFERDKWVCQICGQPVDPSIEYPDLRCKSIDHIVPLSKGGKHTTENVQLAHLVCNISKGNRTCQEVDRANQPP